MMKTSFKPVAPSKVTLAELGRKQLSPGKCLEVRIEMELDPCICGKRTGVRRLRVLRAPNGNRFITVEEVFEP